MFNNSYLFHCKKVLIINYLNKVPKLKTGTYPGVFEALPYRMDISFGPTNARAKRLGIGK